MIIKNICPNILIHPFLYFLIFLLLLTGRVKQLFLFMILIFIHELGHFFAAKFCGWQTDRIELYPYGGISKFTTSVNVPLKEEFFVLIMGPISQIVGFHLFSIFLRGSRWGNLFYTYHIFLLGFNLLPIYPLDGGRLLNLLFCRFLSFYKSFCISQYISFVVLFFLAVYVFWNHFFLFLLILFFLFLKILKERELFPFTFHKFLLERCLYSWKSPRKRVIFESLQMRRDVYHYFKKDGLYFKEEEFLTSELHSKRFL